VNSYALLKFSGGPMKTEWRCRNFQKFLPKPVGLTEIFRSFSHFQVSVLKNSVAKKRL
jgi:hypothetical protein